MNKEITEQIKEILMQAFTEAELYVGETNIINQEKVIELATPQLLQLLTPKKQ